MTGLPDGAIHVAVSPLKGEQRPTFYELQAIKDGMVGPRRTAIEIYPPSDELVDDSEDSATHLWILPEGVQLPYELSMIEDDPSVMGSLAGEPGSSPPLLGQTPGGGATPPPGSSPAGPEASGAGQETAPPGGELRPAAPPAAGALPIADEEVV